MAVIATLRGVARAGATVSSGVGGKVAQLTADTTLASQTTDRATWQVAAGASLDLRVMAMQINGDSTADRIVARVYYETGTATLVRTIYDATPALAAGAAWQAVTTVSFFGTLDGTAGGTPCAGTLRLFIQVIRTGTAGGLSDFDVDSDGNVAVQGALVTSTESYVGVLRVNGQCITLAVGAYPAGSLFANGELIPLSATYIRPFAARGHETQRVDVLSGTTQLVAGTAQAAVLAGTIAQSFTAGSAFALALASYGSALTPVGNAALVPTSGAVVWTVLSPGVGLEQAGNGVRRQSYYNVDPRVYIDSHTQAQGVNTLDPLSADYAQAVIVAGDTPWWAYVNNARIEPINGATVVFERFDPDALLFDTTAALTGPVASNGNRNGWTARVLRSIGAPPGPWTYKTSVTLNGVSAADQYAFTHITPVIANLHVKLQGPVLCQPGQTIRVRLEFEIDDAPADPEDLPVWRVFNPSMAPWALIASGNWRNAVDDTESINGPSYRADIAIPMTAGRYLIWARGQLNGNGLRASQAFRVAADGFDPVGLSAGPD